MAFSDRPAREIRNVLAEPHWGGYRALVQVSGPDVAIRDVDGDEYIGLDALRAAIAEANLALELLLDGYVVPGPLPTGEGSAPVDLESTPTATEMARHLILPGGGRDSRREAYERAMGTHRQPLDPDGEAAFIAMDLLWLDGESLLQLPLLERRRLLESALTDGERVRLNVAVRPPVEAWYGQWKALGFSEFAVKDANSRYVPGGVSREWTIARIPKR
jgi:ATP-dependent DNA ligase